MGRTLLAIITNTFTETLRQPVYGVVVVAGALLLILSPSLSMFTLDDDNQLLKDVGLSTMLVAGLFLAAFAAATVVVEEIENKTVLTVISKTVSRSSFIVGKFIGIVAAVVLGQYLLSIVLLVVVRQGVMQTSSDEADRVVVTLGCSAMALTFLVGLVGNYFYRWRFGSTAVVLGSLLGTILLGVLLFVDPKWQYNPSDNHIAYNLVGPILLTVIATVILTAIAVAASTHLGLIMTLNVCTLMFVLGAVIQYWLGPVAASAHSLSRYLAWVALTVVPSISFFVATNSIYADTPVPFLYIGQTALYALLYVTAVMLFAVALFNRRQIS